jgi:hypothetical protein
MSEWRQLLSLTLLSCALASPAGAHLLEGSVREAGTRRPIPAALVLVTGVDAEGITDEEGRFQLDLGSRPAKGGVQIRVQSPGYQELVRHVALAPAAAGTTVDLYMKPGGEEAAVLVVRERRSPDNQARGSHRIEEREVNEMAGTYGDPAKAIENFPGMGRVKRSQGSLFVRGASPEESAVYVDAFEIPDLYHFTGSTSVINIPFVESVELVPGIYSARFGRALGGLAVVHTRRLPTDDIHGFAKLDIIDGGAYVGVPLSEKAAVGASARRSWLDAVRWGQVASGTDGDDILLIPTYWDYQLKFDADLDPGSELIAFVFGAGDRELYRREETNTLFGFNRIVDSDFHRVSLKYRKNLGGGFSNTLLPVVGYERRLFDESDGLHHRDRQTLDLQVRDEVLYRWSRREKVIFGLDLTARGDLLTFGGADAWRHANTVPSADLSGEVRTQRTEMATGRLTTGLFVEGQVHPLDALLLSPGLRLDGYFYAGNNELSVEPRLVAAWSVLKGPWGLVLKVGSGAFARPPNPEDVVLAQQVGLSLPVSKAFQIQGGLEQSLGENTSLSATVYNAWRSQLIQRSASWPAPPTPLTSPVSGDGAGISTGMELLLRTRMGNMTGWAAYSLARHERIDGGGGAAGEGVPYRYPADFDTTHLLALVGQVPLFWGLRAGARYRIATGMPETVVVTSLFDADQGIHLPVQGPKNQGRFETFQALDLRLDWTFLFPYFELDAYADLINVLNIRPQEDVLYNHDYTQTTPLLGLPMIPTLGVKATF